MNNNKSFSKTSKLKILTVNAPCGSGKTHAILRIIIDNIQHSKYILAVPTINLAEEIYDQLSAQKVSPVTLVTSSTHPYEVISGITEAVKEINQLGNGLLIITQAAALEFPDFLLKRLREWNLVFDEVPIVLDTFEITLPYNHSLLSNLITPSISGLGSKSNLSKFKVKNPNQVKKFLQQDRDDANELIKKPVRYIYEGRHDVFASSAAWDKMTSNKIDPDPAIMKYGNSGNKIQFAFILKPFFLENFKTVTIAGAALNEATTLVYVWNKFYGVQFQTHKRITAQLRHVEHTNGSQLEIVYGQEKAFSKSQAEKIDPETGLSGLEHHINLAQSVMNNQQDILALVNKSSLTRCPRKWKMLSGRPHGSNKYADITQFVFIAAYRFNPQLNFLFISLGIPQQVLDKQMTVDQVYQALMRLGIRNPENPNHFKVYVPSKNIAEELASNFIGCTIRHVDGPAQKVIGVTVKTEAKEKLEKLQEVIKERQEKISNNNLNFDSIKVTVFDDLYSPGQVIETDHSSLHNQLKDLHQSNIYSNKAENSLISPCSYTNNSRKADQARDVSMVILDFDGGDLNEHQIKDILENKESISSYITNTARHLLDGQSRFRVFIPTSRPLTPHEYLFVYGYIENLLVNHHYYSLPLGSDPQKFRRQIRWQDPLAMISGLDLSKKNLSSAFYMPGQLQSNTKNSFFYSIFMEPETFSCHVLDVDKVIQEQLEFHQEAAMMEQLNLMLVTETVPPLNYDSGLLQDDLNQKFLDHQQKIWGRIQQEVIPGHRSAAACSIAGSIKWWPDPVAKLEVMSQLQQKGCDKAALKSAFLYSGLGTRVDFPTANLYNNLVP